jgi:hypothetical protein
MRSTMTEAVGELFVEFLDLRFPSAARLAKNFVFDQRNRATHETARVVVGDAALGGGDDKVGGEGDGDKRTHRQQVEVEKQLGQAVAPATPAR